MTTTTEQGLVSSDSTPSSGVEALIPASSKSFALPEMGQTITELNTKNTYEIGKQIGEGHFSLVFECRDSWDNSLAAKVLKPEGMLYETVKKNANREFQTLRELRHPLLRMYLMLLNFEIPATS